MARRVDEGEIELLAEDEPEVEETKEDAFKRLATARLKKALNSIRLIGNLGTYPHTENHTKAIVDHLRSAVADIEGKLMRVKKSGPNLEGIFEE